MARLRTPHCTSAVQATASIFSILLSFASDSTTPISCGVAPPESPVPAPRATTGTPIRWQIRRIAAACVSVSGSATTMGDALYAVSPSHSYGTVSSWRNNIAERGNTPASAAATSDWRVSRDAWTGAGASGEWFILHIMHD